MELVADHVPRETFVPRHLCLDIEGTFRSLDVVPCLGPVLEPCDTGTARERACATPHDSGKGAALAPGARGTTGSRRANDNPCGSQDLAAAHTAVLVCEYKSEA